LCSRESIHAAELRDRPLILADEGPSSGLNAQLVAVLDRWGTRMTRGQTELDCSEAFIANTVEP
jgi:hypothetical protein